MNERYTCVHGFVHDGAWCVCAQVHACVHRCSCLLSGGNPLQPLSQLILIMPFQQLAWLFHGDSSSFDDGVHN